MLNNLQHTIESESSDKLIAELLPSARTMLGMEVAFVSEFRDGRRVFRHVATNGEFAPIQVNGSDPLEESYCQRVVDGRLPELITDAGQNDEAKKLPATQSLPVGAHLSVPIRFKSGRVYGTFCCFSREPDSTLGVRDMATMHFFADILGRVLEAKDSADATRRCVLERIKKVIDEHLYSVVFQAIFDITHSKVVGFEALARFQGQPYRPPNEWLEDAASVGLLAELEECLQREALGQLANLPADTYLSLNVSPDTVLAPNFAERFLGHPLERLVLEITEHELVADYAELVTALAHMRVQGIRLAIDDVGAGYANFRHILKLRPDIIKLDGALIKNLDSEVDCRLLVAAFVQFAKGFGCRVIAEGLETQAERVALQELGIRFAQGYLLGRPGTVESVA